MHSVSFATLSLFQLDLGQTFGPWLWAMKISSKLLVFTALLESKFDILNF